MSETSDDQERKRRERLERLVDPSTTAVLTMELQRGIVGPTGMLPALVDQVAERGVLAAAGRVCDSARKAGARVVHCTAEFRPDGAGATENCKIFALGEKLRREQGLVPTAMGSEGARLAEELGPEPSDIIVPRMHGMTPFTSTSLDQMLRNLGVRTVVATGVSVNLGVLGMCLSALDLGYQIVLVRDAVAGVPEEYAQAVVDHTLSLITTITTSDELCSVWAS
ncbi:MAG: cysteine hydrolase [Acidimicrobiales bacterium]|nr:cysteine hydrolase [Acidimicrobiales bacterium]